MVAVVATPANWRMVVLDLQQLFDAELAFIPAVKAAAPHCRVVLAHANGRPAMLARAIRLGIDGLLTGDKIEWLSAAEAGGWSVPALHQPAQPPTRVEATDPEPTHDDHATQADHAELRSVADIYQDEPLLTADELKALLSDHNIRPPGG